MTLPKSSSRQRWIPFRWAAALAAVMMLAVACGSSDEQETAPAPSPTPTPAATIAPPEPTATPTAIPEVTEAPDEPTPQATATGFARALSLEDAVGQLFLIGIPGPQLETETADALDRIKPGGVILFDYDGPSGGEVPRNIVSPEQLRQLVTDLQSRPSIPYFVAIDAEGGFVNRLKEKYGFTVAVPSAQTLGQGAPSDTAAIIAALAAEMNEMGINWNLAPVVDVNVFPESPAIGYWERSFSADPAVVADHAEAFIGALQQGQVIPTLKHFPGHGSAVGDTHLGVTDVTASYIAEDELAPYRELIDGGYDDVVMTAHIVNRNLDATATPATLSAPIMTDLLRGDLGFEGVVISDDMQMGAIVEEYTMEHAVIAAINAGVDVILMANQAAPYDPVQIEGIKQAIIDAVQNGEISEDRIYQSVERILALKRKYGIIEP